MSMSMRLRATALVAGTLWVSVGIMVAIGLAGGASWPSLESLLRAAALTVTVVGVQLHTSMPERTAYRKGRADEKADGGRRAGDPRPTTAELRIIRGGRGV